jgi:hypothetical protein
MCQVIAGSAMISEIDTATRDRATKQCPKDLVLKGNRPVELTCEYQRGDALSSPHKGAEKGTPDPNEHRRMALICR